MYASRYMVIPLPWILTYTKCMLVNACLIPLPGILTYTKCMPVNTCLIPLSTGILTYTKCMPVNTWLIPLSEILTYTKCMPVDTWSIPLPGILTYSKCMLVHASNHSSHISFVHDDFTTRQFTQPFTLNTHTFSNSHFTLVIYIKSWNLT
jgi:hypothetical protein